MPFNMTWIVVVAAFVLSVAALFATRGKRFGPVIVPWVGAVLIIAIADPSALGSAATAVRDFATSLADKAITD